MFISSTTCLLSCSGSCFWLLPASMASLHPLCLSTVPPVACPARGRVSGCYGRLWLLYTHYVYPQYHLSPVLLGVVFLAATGVYGFSAPIMFIHSTTCRLSCSGSCFWLLPASMASLHPLCLSTVPPVSCPARGRVSGCYRRLWLLCTHYVYPQYHLSPVLLGVVFLAATGIYGFSAPIMFIRSTTCLPSCSGSCFWLLLVSMASLHPLCLFAVPPVSCPARGRVSGCYWCLWLLCTHYVFIRSTTCLPSCSGSCFWLLPASMASLHPLCLSTVPPVSRPARGRVSGCYRHLWLLYTHYVYPQYHLSPVLLGVVFLAATGVYGFSAPIWGYIADKKVKHYTSYSILIIHGLTVIDYKQLIMLIYPICLLTSRLAIAWDMTRRVVCRSKMARVCKKISRNF